MTQRLDRPRPNPRPRATPVPAPAAPPPVNPARQRKEALAMLAATTERATYEDETGRKWTVLVPKGRAEDAALGVVVGPPDLRDALSDRLPETALVTLHNELFARGLLTEQDLRGRGPELQAALMAALRVDVQRIHMAYRDGGKATGSD